MIGKVTVKQMADRAPGLLSSGLDLRLAGATDSKSMIVADGDAGFVHAKVDEAIAERVEDWDASAIAATIEPVDLKTFVARLEAAAERTGGAAIVVDNTSSEAVADLYEGWLSRGVHVVTPNKKANSGDLKRFEKIKNAAKEGNAKWLYEGTIGAGLPIVSTLRTLRASGDEVRVVQGIFSGTMSFLFNTWDPNTTPFSTVVLAAKEAGYTEPDPRDDLNGLDVARKVVIAARESGMNISLDDVSVASLVPAALEDCDTNEYVERLPEFDGVIKKQALEAAERGMVLRFVGKVDVANGTGSVELAEFSKTHPFAGLEGADNIVEIRTKRYSDEMESTPLIIRGPGAGAQVTAGGVFGDVCKLGVILGADTPL